MTSVIGMLATVVALASTPFPELSTPRIKLGPDEPNSVKSAVAELADAVKRRTGAAMDYSAWSSPSAGDVFVSTQPWAAKAAWFVKEKNGILAVHGSDFEGTAAAVAWTLNNIAAYGGDTNKVFVSGMSAGGYLTMMVGMAPAYLAKHGFKPTDLAGIVPVSGQATKHFAVRQFAGDNDPQYLPKIDELAPLRWVGADLPPILDVCGQPPYERKCRSEENRLLVASCVALGHKNARFVECQFCDRVQVTGLKILVNVEYSNNDGLHINCCRDVTVSDCIIESGDDAIVVRANSRSLAENKPCKG